MACPTSTTLQIGDAQAAAGDDIIIARGVTISVGGAKAIDFNSAGHSAEIFGTVVSTTAAIELGADAGVNSLGHTVNAYAGAFIRGFGDAGIHTFGFGTSNPPVLAANDFLVI